MANDLSKIGALDETAVVTLFHPVDDVPLENDDGDPMTITVYGKDSSIFRDVLRNQKNRALQKAQRSQRINITAEMQEANAEELLAKCVKDWTIVIGGEIPPVTYDSVRQVLRDYPWIKEQIDTAIDDRRNFMRA